MKSEVILRVNDLARGGAGVCRDSGGRVVFIPFSAPGDLIRVQIVKENKRYAEGSILEIIEPSKDRQVAPCKVFSRCGGCQWQHLPYSLQWATKVKGVESLLKREFTKSGQFPLLLGNQPALESQGEKNSGRGFSLFDQIPAEKIWEYRNRIQLRGRGEEIGFFQSRSHQLIPIQRCEIARPEINQRLDTIRREGKQLQKSYKVEVEVKPEGQVHLSWNSQHSSHGFRQIHDEQNEKLKNWVVETLSDGDVLYDLFGGAGNFSFSFLKKMKKIHCVDLSSPLQPPAQPLIQSTSQSPKQSRGKFQSGFDNKKSPHLFFHATSVLEWLRNQKTEKQATLRAAAILDPPREGLGEQLDEISDHLERLGVTELITIGCDADAWVRDLQGWLNRGWVLKKGLLIDLFPQTIHIECVAFLKTC